MMLEWTFLDTWIVITGALSAMACALPGNYLVLRRMSMMGDAISHTVLPGLAIAFLITGSRDSLTMLVGATLVGVLTAYLVQAVFRLSGLDRGATMGVIFTTFFALGLILIRQAADHVDLDPGCVLYGAIELTPLDVREVFGFEIPRAALTSGAALLLNAGFVTLFYKELRISSFDPALATTLGINAGFMHYALMTTVAATTVVAFESVGSILVIAMLIVPAASAWLLTDRLWVMILISLVIGALSAVLGHISAITVPTWFGFRDTSTAGMMSVAAGAIFLMSFLFSPRYGLVSRFLGQGMLTLRITRDDLLGFLYRYHELTPAGADRVSMTDIRAALRQGAWTYLAIWDLRRRGWAEQIGEGVRLTAEGLDRGRGLIRSHRLWEAYLYNRLGVDAGAVHFSAHQLEHYTDPAMQSELDRETVDSGDIPSHRKIPQARR
ncbi:metal ABC transporter permease [Desulfonema ishimotonii]|nr:metal ABC transporter permease [Desulfonema ishimotonii]